MAGVRLDQGAVKTAASRAGVVRRQVAFADVGTFLREYRSNIVHGGLFVAWDAPPGQGTPVVVDLAPPLDLPHLELPATVVYTSAAGAGIQLDPRSSDLQRQLMETVRRCEEQVAAQGRAKPSLLQHVVKYASPQSFLQSWDAELRLGGMLVPIVPPPPPDTTVRLLLQGPITPDPIRLEARVVYQGTTGAGVQLNLTADKRQELQQLVDRCRHLVVSESKLEAARALSTGAPSQSEAVGGSGEEPATPAHASGSVQAGNSPLPGDQVSQRVPDPPVTPPEEGALVLAHGPLPVSMVAARGQSSDGYPETKPVNVRLASTEMHAVASIGAPASARPVRESWSGSLSTTNIFEILLKLGRTSATGVLEVVHGSSSCSVGIAQGYAVTVVQFPPDPAMRLGAILVHDGQLGLAEAEEAVVHARKEGMLLGQFLIREGSVMATTLNQALLRQNQLRLWAVARWTRGDFRFMENARLPRTVGTPPASILHVLFRERMNDYRLNQTDQLATRVSQVAELYLHRMPEAPDDMSGYGLNNEEQRFWHQVAIGRYSVRECFLVSPLSKNRTFAVLFTLLELGLVRLLPDMTREWRVQLARELIEKKFARMLSGNLFDILDAHWSCSELEIQERYASTKAEYDSRRFSVPLPDEVHRMSKEILSRCDQAMKTLGTWEGRRTFRKELVEPQQLANAGDLLHQQADMAFFKHEYKEALGLYARSLELEPGQAEVARKYKELGRRLAGLAPGSAGPDEL